MYRSVIFDLDGTLVDSSRGIIRATTEALETLGYPSMTSDEIRSLIGPPIGTAIVKSFGYDESEIPRFNNVFRDLYKNKYLMEAEIYSGITSLLECLKKKCFLSVATNKRCDYTRTMLDNLNISHHFDAIEGSDFDGKLSKKDLIERCISAFEVSRPEIVMVGDTENDAFAAEECGIDFIGVLYGMGFDTSEDVPYGTVAESTYALMDMLC